MSDYDELEFDPQPGPPNLAGLPTARKCRRHVWWHRTATVEGKLIVDEWSCRNCYAIKDEALSRRGRTSRKRGNSLELWFCQQLGLEKVGQMGTEVDGRTPGGFAGNALFSAQVKSGLQFPGWMQRILDGLPRTGGRVPILGIVETPGAGHRRRALVVMTLEDFRDLHGPER